MMALRWWRNETARVASVLDMAYLRDGEVDPVHDSACELVGEHAGTVREVAVLLDRIERLTCGAALPSEIADWAGVPSWPNISDAAFRLVGEYKDEAVAAATKVAELLRVSV